MNQIAEFRTEPRSIAPQAAPMGAPVRIVQAPVGLIVAGALLGSVMAAVGSFMPWAKASFLFMSMEVSGVEAGDGIISLVAAVAAGVLSLLILGQNARLFGFLTMIAGGVAAATALYDIGNYYQMVSEEPLVGGLTELAEGIYITAAGGAIAAGSGLLALLSAGPRTIRPTS